jgi:hypothetical protein
MDNRTRLFDPTKEQLGKLYETHTLQEIADMHGVNPETVRKRIHEFGIKTRRTGPAREFIPSKRELSDLYQRMSMRDISRKFHVGETVVWKRLKEFGIKLRDYEDGGHRKKPGRTFSEQHRRNLSLSKRAKGRTGEKSPSWRGGMTAINYRLRTSSAYKQWKREALALWGNKCSNCGVVNKSLCNHCGHKTTLHVHHVRSFAKFPADRFDPKNSEVLCAGCHYSKHRRKIG